MWRWWQAPEPELPLEEGARALREALLEAVDLRARGGGVLGMDLSGGLDSTSLCFLAARTGARLVTVTLRWAAAGNEDAIWADRAAAHLPGCERLVYGPDQLPAFFTGIGSLGDGGSADEPTMDVREGAQQDVIDQELLARGVRLRLAVTAVTTWCNPHPPTCTTCSAAPRPRRCGTRSATGRGTGGRRPPPPGCCWTAPRTAGGWPRPATR